MMTNLDATAIIVSLPTISGEMNLSPSHASIIVLAYLLFETAPLMVFGKIGDIYGGRRVLLTGLALFTISSFFCGKTSNLWQLMVMRSLQGIGEAMIISVMVALATLHTPASVSLNANSLGNSGVEAKLLHKESTQDCKFRPDG